jgi:DNA-binding MarR family transcriptional regulator
VPLEVLHSIVAAGAGVPRNLVRLAQEVFVSDKQLKDEKTNQEQLRRAIDELGRPAAMLAVELAQLGPVSASDQRLLTRTGWSRPRAVQVLRQLEEAGFVESGSTIQGGRRRKLYWLSRSAP